MGDGWNWFRIGFIDGVCGISGVFFQDLMLCIFPLEDNPEYDTTPSPCSPHITFFYFVSMQNMCNVLYNYEATHHF